MPRRFSEDVDEYIVYMTGVFSLSFKVSSEHDELSRLDSGSMCAMNDSPRIRYL